MVDLIFSEILNESEESSNNCGVCRQEKSASKYKLIIHLFVLV